MMMHKDGKCIVCRKENKLIMKAKFIYEAFEKNSKEENRAKLLFPFHNEIRDAILAGAIYKNAPSTFDPDEKAVYISHLSSEYTIFYYVIIGGTDIYGINAIDKSGTIWEKGSDISSQFLNKDKIIKRIQKIFPSPPKDMKRIGEVHSLEEFIEFFNRYSET